MTGTDIKDYADNAARLVLPLLRRYLRSRYRLLSAEHDDLVQETLADLYVYLQERSQNLPGQEELPAVATAILKRRVADRFRAEARRVARVLEDADESLERAADKTAPVDEVVRYRRLLSAVLGLVADMSAADQNLLLADVLPGLPSGPLSPADRKRLSRLRERLRAELRSKLGSLADDYLAE